MKRIGDDYGRALAKEPGALPCLCCGAAPFVNRVCFRPTISEDDPNAGLGMAIMCSDSECRLSTAVAIGKENWMEAVHRWNRRVDNAIERGQSSCGSDNSRKEVSV